MRLSHKLLWFVSFTSFVLSCQDDGGHHSSVADLSVVFTTGMSTTNEIFSRAANASWDEGDQVGIYMVPHVANASDAANLSSGYAASSSNVPYVVLNSGASLSVVNGHNPITYPENSDEINFVAYYPYQSDMHTKNEDPHIYQVDVSDQDPLSEIDLLYHKGTGTSYSRHNSENVSLVFSHQLSNMKITLTLSDDVTVDLNDATVVLSGFPTTADFDLSTGILDGLDGDDTPLTPIKDDDNSSERQALFEAILVPHQGSDYNNRRIDFTIEDKVYSYPFDTSFHLEKGLSYSYTFTFTGSKLYPTDPTITLPYNPTTSDELIITTSAASLTATPSGNSNSITAAPNWLLAVLTEPTTDPATNWDTYSLTATSSSYNITTSDAARTGYIHLREGTTTKQVVTVIQECEELYVNTPSPSSFANVIAAGKTGNSFSIKTNDQEDIEVETDNDELITNLTKSKGTVASDGSSTWTIGFAVTENSTMSTRSGSITVTIGGQPKTVTFSQFGTPTTATTSDVNCFMVAPGSKGIQFGPSRPIALTTTATSASTFTVHKLWDDTDCVDTDCVDTVYVSGIGSNAKISVIPTNTSGNALIALKVGSEIVWSYHIWVTGPISTWTNNEFIMMDRNLGATSNMGTGVFYQWGRKDPFPYTEGTVETQRGPASHETARKNPDKFITVNGGDWSDSPNTSSWQEVLDPCPSGWKVPAFTDLGPFSGFTAEHWNGSGLEGLDTFIPITGLLHANYGRNIYHLNDNTVDNPNNTRSTALFSSQSFNSTTGYFFDLTGSSDDSVSVTIKMNAGSKSYGRLVRCVQD